MFERYAEKTRRALFFAREGALQAGAREIGTEHLLLGMMRDSSDVVQRLAGRGATEGALLAELEKLKPAAGETGSGGPDLPLSNQCKRVLAYAAEEAERLGSRIITPGHLLLGLMREKDGVAARALGVLGATLEAMRKAAAVEPQDAGVDGNTGEVKVNSAYGHLRKAPDWATQDMNKVGFEYYTEQARRAIFFARWEASRRGTGKMEPEHLLLGIWREAAVELNDWTDRTDEWPELQQMAERMPLTDVPTSADMGVSDELREVLAMAAEEAKGMKSQVGVGHLTLGLLRKNGCFAGELLRGRGAEVERVRKAMRE